jgi:hypothetical protein
MNDETRKFDRGSVQLLLDWARRNKVSTLESTSYGALVARCRESNGSMLLFELGGSVPAERFEFTRGKYTGRGSIPTEAVQAAINQANQDAVEAKSNVERMERLR